MVASNSLFTYIVTNIKKKLQFIIKQYLLIEESSNIGTFIERSYNDSKTTVERIEKQS